tara:strand:+ start:366 stop:1142 length:777 start_codon:yes stop_codon:yes gene_type:complete
LPHISYSELKNWEQCPFKHKLVHIDKIKGFTGNEYTAFGTALHTVCEDLLTEHIGKDVDESELFIVEFRKEIRKLDVELRKEMIINMFEQGKKIAPIAIPHLQEHFGKFEVFATEEKLYEEMEGLGGYLFKGFIDLVIKTEDNKIHIIDYKTCSWGWGKQQRSNKMIAYQLVLYKHFFCKKYNIKPEDVETHFCLLKRTAKTNIVEIFSTTSGPKRTKNAIELLARAVKTIKNKIHIKNRLACTSGFGCEFYRTEHCK